MATQFLTTDELDDLYGEDRIASVSTVENETEPIDGYVEKKILVAESWVKSILLARYSLQELPDRNDPVKPDPSDNLKQIVADATWVELHKRFETQSETVASIGQAAKEKLLLIARSKASLPLLLAGEQVPIDRSQRKILHSRSRSDRMTMENFEDW